MISLKIDSVRAEPVMQGNGVATSAKHANVTRSLAPGRFPTLFILGAQKSATTSLTMLLEGARNVQLFTRLSRECDKCYTKRPRAYGETHYLNDCPSYVGGCTTESFAQMFAPAENPGMHSLDPTPNYLPATPVPSLLRQLMPLSLWPNARFFVVLREPVTRMLS